MIVFLTILNSGSLLLLYVFQGLSLDQLLSMLLHSVFQSNGLRRMVAKGLY